MNESTKNKTHKRKPFDELLALESLSLFAKKIRTISNKYELIDYLKDEITKTLQFSTASIYRLAKEPGPRRAIYTSHSTKNTLVDAEVNIASHQVFDIDGDPWMEHIMDSESVVYAADMMKHPLTNKEHTKIMQVETVIAKRIDIIDNTLIICISNHKYDSKTPKITERQLIYFEMMCDLIKDILDIKMLKHVRLFEENNLLTILGMKWHVSRLVSSKNRNFKPFGIVNISLLDIEDDIYPDLLRVLSIEIKSQLRQHELLTIHDNSILICIDDIDSFPIDQLVKRIFEDFNCITYKQEKIQLILNVTFATSPTDGIGFDQLLSTSENRKAKAAENIEFPSFSLFD